MLPPCSSSLQWDSSPNLSQGHSPLLFLWPPLSWCPHITQPFNPLLFLFCESGMWPQMRDRQEPACCSRSLSHPGGRLSRALTLSQADKRKGLYTHDQQVLDTECDHMASFVSKQGQSLFTSAFKEQRGSNLCLFLSLLQFPLAICNLHGQEYREWETW